MNAEALDRPYHRKEAMRLAQELKASRRPPAELFREWLNHMRATLAPAQPNNNLSEIYRRMWEQERRVRL